MTMKDTLSTWKRLEPILCGSMGSIFLLQTVLFLRVDIVTAITKKLDKVVFYKKKKNNRLNKQIPT